MLHVYVQKFDVTDIVEIFLGTKQGFIGMAGLKFKYVMWHD